MKSEEKNNFVYRFLNLPFFYLIIQNIMYKSGSRYQIFKNHFQLDQTLSILEIGCGPAINRSFIKNIKYVGIDINCSHIKKAKNKFPNDNFFCLDATDFEYTKLGKIDAIVICHLLHHLNDYNVSKLLSGIYEKIQFGENVYLIDIVYLKNQHPIAWLLGKLDKGNYVRDFDNYIKLFDEKLFNVEYKIVDNLLRLPCNFAITKLSKIN